MQALYYWKNKLQRATLFWTVDYLGDQRIYDFLYSLILSSIRLRLQMFTILLSYYGIM